ncbi:MAG TPA: ribosome-associated translation inhibitor RaiA [Bryobacteraceae bacterium]|jgi:putative sigma-54 modulation protein|nr:ribosome-associated translation inhibitor RaiA [Bryobacteraceae bacterium]
MRLVYTGRNVEFPPQQMRKLDAKLDRIRKLMGRNGDKDAHVIVRQERHLQNVEITVNAWDHQMVALGADGDLFTAMNSALEKLEKQVSKLRTKWRDTKRTAPAVNEAKTVEAAPVQTAVNRAQKAKMKKTKSAAPVSVNAVSPRVFRVDQNGDGVPDHRHKPMTVDEAMLEIGPKEDYLMFLDAESNRLSVLLRRKDGNFDLIEG